MEFDASGHFSFHTAGHGHFIRGENRLDPFDDEAAYTYFTDSKNAIYFDAILLLSKFYRSRGRVPTDHEVSSLIEYLQELHGNFDFSLTVHADPFPGCGQFVWHR
jgi:hypothetical protein